jgi:hypothetical protein
MSTPQEKSKPTELEETATDTEVEGRQSVPPNTSVPQDGAAPNTSVPQDNT